MKFKTLTAAAVALTMSAPVAAFAATLDVDASGQLLGATRVDVNGTYYDVSFVDGDCGGLFDGCDDLSDFDFDTQTAAEAASQALLDQVFLGQFDDNPNLTNGCSEFSGCRVYTPFQVGNPVTPTVFASKAQNQDNNIDFEDTVELLAFSSLAGSDGSVYARWERATTAPVPLPAGGVLLLTGLAGIAALRRGKKVGI